MYFLYTKYLKKFSLKLCKLSNFIFLSSLKISKLCVLKVFFVIYFFYYVSSTAFMGVLRILPITCKTCNKLFTKVFELLIKFAEYVYISTMVNVFNLKPTYTPPLYTHLRRYWKVYTIHYNIFTTGEFLPNDYIMHFVYSTDTTSKQFRIVNLLLQSFAFDYKSTKVLNSDFTYVLNYDEFNEDLMSAYQDILIGNLEESTIPFDNSKQLEILYSYSINVKDSSGFVFFPYSNREIEESMFGMLAPILIHYNLHMAFEFPTNAISNAWYPLGGIYLYTGVPFYVYDYSLVKPNTRFRLLYRALGNYSVYFYTMHNALYAYIPGRLLHFKKFLFFKNKPSIIRLVNIYLKFVSAFYFFFKNVLIGISVGLLFIYVSFFLYKLSFIKALFNWVGLGLFVFWLLSTFNFFLKRYRYSKYTSAIQRFWKRAYMCFWIIEGFLFMIFFYYLLNASAEPIFMYDTYGLYITQLISLKTFLLNAYLIVLVINLVAYLLINIKTVSLRKGTILLLFVTVALLYVLFVESYQFYYLLNFYDEYTWVLAESDNVWELESDKPRTRNRNHYLTLIIIAKFWHYIFIFASWVFFVVKTLELNRIRYAFLSMNYQNIILFYIMNWLCLYSWLKWIFRRFADQTYYWFFTSFRPTTINIIVNDLLLYVRGILTSGITCFKSTFNFNFFHINIDLITLYGQASYFKFIISSVFA